jgi:hypothetical protein
MKVDICNIWTFEEKLESYRIHLSTMQGCYIISKEGENARIQYEDGTEATVPILTLRREDQINW